MLFLYQVTDELSYIYHVSNEVSCVYIPLEWYNLSGEVVFFSCAM